VTRAERAVLAVLADERAFLSAQQIHARLVERSQRVGLTSVYRAVQSLVAARVLDVQRTDAGEATYRRCGSDTHHHHLVCRRCGRTVEIAAPGVERWVTSVTRSHGFHAPTHTLEITGVCAGCTSADGGEVSA
jgi:Fur family transcriptional regulator, ferric uptake regulator